VINPKDVGSINITPLDKIIFFSLELDDGYNAKIVGSSKSFCWNGFCTFPPVKSKLLYYSI